MKTLRSVVSLVFVLALSSPAWARMPRSREFCGTLNSILLARHQMVVVKSASDQLTAVWDKQTQFVHGGKVVNATALDSGETVCAYYHSPFFGPTYLTKVVW